MNEYARQALLKRRYDDENEELRIIGEAFSKYLVQVEGLTEEERDYEAIAKKFAGMAQTAILAAQRIKTIAAVAIDTRCENQKGAKC